MNLPVSVSRGNMLSYYRRAVGSHSRQEERYLICENNVNVDIL